MEEEVLNALGAPASEHLRFPEKSKRRGQSLKPPEKDPQARNGERSGRGRILLAPLE